MLFKGLAEIQRIVKAGQQCHLGNAVILTGFQNCLGIGKSPVGYVLSGAFVGILGIRMPDFVGNFLTKSTACMGPVSMLLTGIVISEYSLRDIFANRPVYILTALRLLVIPCTVAGILRLIGLEYAVLPTLATLAVSCGMNTIVFPKLIGEDCKTGAALACISTICCCFTIPFCLWLFGIGV